MRNLFTTAFTMIFASKINYFSIIQNAFLVLFSGASSPRNFLNAASKTPSITIPPPTKLYLSGTTPKNTNCQTYAKTISKVRQSDTVPACSNLNASVIHVCPKNVRDASAIASIQCSSPSGT